MFVLIDPTERKELRFGDITVSYFEAPGDACYEAVVGIERDPVTGKPLKRANVTDFMASYVTDVTGIADAKGTLIPWPGAGKRPPGTVGDLLEIVGPSEIVLRQRLLARLPWNVLAAIDAAVARSWSEGAASGKG